MEEVPVDPLEFAQKHMTIDVIRTRNFHVRQTLNCVAADVSADLTHYCLNNKMNPMHKHVLFQYVSDVMRQWWVCSVALPNL